MDSAFVYNPDDERDEARFNGHAFPLRPNGTTEFLPFDAELLKDEAALRELEWKGSEPTGKVMVRWPDVTPAEVAAHVVEKLGQWGVRATVGPVENGRVLHADDEAAIEAAEKQYLIATRDWCVGILKAHAEETKKYAEIGLAFQGSAEAHKARAWILAKEGALRDAGLL